MQDYIGEVYGTMDLDPEQIGVDLARIGGKCAEDVDLIAAHEAESDGWLDVGLEFGLDEETGGVDLTLPPGGEVVSVERGGGVVEHDEGRFQCHF